MSNLAAEKCVPCRGSIPPLSPADQQAYLERLGADWQVVGDHHLEKRFAFDDFKSALAYVVRIGELAEEVGHHPDLHLGWGYVVVQIWTHKVNGLTPSDFVFAAKTERLVNSDPLV